MFPGKGAFFGSKSSWTLGKSYWPPPRVPWNLAGLRILLAEDNRVNQLVAKEILAKVGIQPVVVSNGLQAVEKVEAESFDLVLMDLQMPGHGWS